MIELRANMSCVICNQSNETNLKLGVACSVQKLMLDPGFCPWQSSSTTTSAEWDMVFLITGDPEKSPQLVDGTSTAVTEYYTFAKNQY